MKQTTVTRGGGNIFADLGLPNADEHMLKARLVICIDKMIEQKKQIAGLDFFTKEERREVLVELAELYMEDRAGYELRRNELQPWFGCTKGAIDDDVKLFLKRYVPALPKPDDDPVSELVAIGKREPTVLWRYNRTGYVTFHRDGHFENHEVDSDDFEDFLSDMGCTRFG